MARLTHSAGDKLGGQVGFVRQSGRFIQSMEDAAVDGFLHGIFTLSGLASQPTDVQMAMLRSCLSDDVMENMGLTEAESKDVIIILKRLERHSRHWTGEPSYATRAFNLRVQEAGETFDDFVTSLRDMSKDCGFCDNCRDSLIRDRVVNIVKFASPRTQICSRFLITKYQISLETCDMIRYKQECTQHNPPNREFRCAFRMRHFALENESETKSSNFLQK